MHHFISIATIAISLNINAQKTVDLINTKELATLINTSNSKLTIFNFWATWCGPCIKEIPYFEKATDSFDQITLYFISVDLIDQHGKVIELIKKKDISSKTFLLNEKDPDNFIRMINEKWSGSIPATLIVKENSEKFFFEKSFKEEELLETITNLYNK